MDSAVEKAFFVHMPHMIVKFKQLKNNLSESNPSDTSNYITTRKYETKNIQMMNVVEDNPYYISER